MQNILQGGFEKPGFSIWMIRPHPFCELTPRLQRPMPRRRAGRRGENEHLRKPIQWRLPAEADRCGRPAVEQARGLLAGEGNGPGPIALHLGGESRDVFGPH